METRIYLDFSRGTRLGLFVEEKEITQLDEFYYGLIDISHIDIIPRIGESFTIGYEGYGYQKKLLKEIEKHTKDSGSLFEIDYIVRDVTHSFGANEIGDIHFINILLSSK